MTDQLREALRIHDEHEPIDPDTLDVLMAAARLVADGKVIPVEDLRATMQGFEPGWCKKHNDLARRWPDGSWSCWWECSVELDGRHQPEDFQAARLWLGETE